MSGIHTLKTRFLVAFVFGLCVAGVTIYLVPGSGSPLLVYPQQRTRRQIEMAVRSLNDYHAQKGTFLRPSTPEARDVVSVLDGWRRPLHYSLPDGKPLVESFGRDGIRGGVGFDADLSNRVLHPASEKIPIWQNLTHPLNQEMIIVALICGVLAGGIVFYGLPDETMRSPSRIGFSLSLLVAFGMATLGAMTITAIHVPSGH